MEESKTIIVMDHDGTTATQDWIPHLVRRVAIKTFGLPFLWRNKEEIEALVRGLREPETEKERAFMATLEKEWVEEAKKKQRIISGASALFKKAEERQVPVVILSSAFQKALDNFYASYDLALEEIRGRERGPKEVQIKEILQKYKGYKVVCIGDRIEDCLSPHRNFIVTSAKLEYSDLEFLSLFLIEVIKSLDEIDFDDILSRP